MDADGLAEGRFLSPPKLGKGRGLAGPQEGAAGAKLIHDSRRFALNAERRKRCLAGFRPPRPRRKTPSDMQIPPGSARDYRWVLAHSIKSASVTPLSGFQVSFV